MRYVVSYVAEGLPEGERYYVSCVDIESYLERATSEIYWSRESAVEVDLQTALRMIAALAKPEEEFGGCIESYQIEVA